MMVKMITPKRQKDPLYHVYDGQYRPQAAFLDYEISSGIASWGWSGEIGNAVPERVWDGSIIRWSVDPKIKWSTLWKISRDPRLFDVLSAISETEFGSDERWNLREEVVGIINEHSPIPHHMWRWKPNSMKGTQ